MLLTESEKKGLREVATFKELLDVAVSVLARLPKPVVIVCGPITTGGLGSEELNTQFFARAISCLQEKGFTVFDQMVFHEAIQRLIHGMPPQEYPMDVLEVFCNGLFRSGHIEKAYFLPGWESSKGARWERERLSKMGFPMEDFNPA